MNASAGSLLALLSTPGSPVLLDGKKTSERPTDCGQSFGTLTGYSSGKSQPLTATYKLANGSTDSTVTWNYDPTTHLLSSVVDSAAPGSQTWSYAYDSLDRATSVTTPYGSVTYTLNDKLSRVESMQVSGQGAISYGYDNNDNVTSITQNGLTATLTYDKLNRLVSQSLPATTYPVVASWTFDPAGLLTGVSSVRNGTTLDSHTYTRDAVGNITQEVIGGANPSTSTFAYDDLYRLTSATVAGTSYSYVYDQVGNCTSRTAGGVATSFTFDSADHLTGVGGYRVYSDADGNVTEDDYTGWLYTWDVRGRLIGASRGTPYTFQYGPDNLRVSKSVNGVLTTYLLNGDQVVTDTINGTANQTLYGPGTDHPLARNGEYFLANQLSSTTELTDGSGNVTQSYQYDPFGMLLNSPTDSNPFQFTGRENDGDGLLYCRARYYNPFWGRFLSADPLGFAAGINPYVHVGDNPVNHGDPSGMDDDEEPVGDLGESSIDLFRHDAPLKSQGFHTTAAVDANTGRPVFTIDNPGGAGAGAEPPGGYTLTTEPVAPPKTVVIGENMKYRVIPYAEENGYEYYRPRGIAESPAGMVNNARWMYSNIRAGVNVVDIGPDLARVPEDTGFNYPMEANILVDADYPFEYDPQPPSSGGGGSGPLIVDGISMNAASGLPPGYAFPWRFP